MGRSSNLKALVLAWAVAALSTSARAETDISVYVGPAGGLLQDVKVRNFDVPGRQVWWREHHVRTSLDAEEGVSLRHFFGRRFGVQGEFFHDENSVRANMESTQFAAFTMQQARSVLMLSAVGRHQMRRLRGSWLYGTAGLGGVYAHYSYIPDSWELGGKFSVGLDLASARPVNLFVELNYLWHHDVGDTDQGTGQRLKTSGNPTWNPATFLLGPHYDSSILGLMVGLRFKVGEASRKWYGQAKAAHRVQGAEPWPTFRISTTKETARASAEGASSWPASSSACSSPGPASGYTWQAAAGPATACAP